MEFSTSSAAAALDRKPAEVEECCEELARRLLFIRSLGAGEWPDRTVASRYRFVHALHRNALYEAISPARRRELHMSIAEREEVGCGDRARDIAAELAAHFEQAGDNRRAAQYLAKAAETASRRHANQEAVGYVSRALDIAERLPDGERVAARLGLLKQLGLLRRSMGAVRDSIEDFTARARYAREHGRDDEEVRALSGAGERPLLGRSRPQLCGHRAGPRRRAASGRRLDASACARFPRVPAHSPAWMAGRGRRDVSPLAGHRAARR
jgi:hypothetical protein